MRFPFLPFFLLQFVVHFILHNYFMIALYFISSCVYKPLQTLLYCATQHRLSRVYSCFAARPSPWNQHLLLVNSHRHQSNGIIFIFKPFFTFASVIFLAHEFQCREIVLSWWILYQSSGVSNSWDYCILQPEQSIVSWTTRVDGSGHMCSLVHISHWVSEVYILFMHTFVTSREVIEFNMSYLY